MSRLSPRQREIAAEIFRRLADMNDPVDYEGSCRFCEEPIKEYAVGHDFATNSDAPHATDCIWKLAKEQ